MRREARVAEARGRLRVDVRCQAARRRGSSSGRAASLPASAAAATAAPGGSAASRWCCRVWRAALSAAAILQAPAVVKWGRLQLSKGPVALHLVTPPVCLHLQGDWLMSGLSLRCSDIWYQTPHALQHVPAASPQALA